MAFALVLALTPLAFLLSRWIKTRLSLPVLTGLAVYFPFLLEVQNSPWRGLALLICWTILQSGLVLVTSLRNPEAMRLLIWRSEEYTNKMFHWIETGVLPEGSAERVVWFHCKQTLLYCCLALVSANLGSLMLGSALLNSMNYYVARLALQSTQRRKALWMGWHPWSVVRVLAFLYLGLLFSNPSLLLLFPVTFLLTPAAVVVGLIAVTLDMFLKLSLSPYWRSRLKANLLIN